MMNKNSLPTIVLGVPLFLSALGCSSEAPVAAAEKDNWYLEPPAGETQTELVDPATYAPVVPERIAEAEEFLAEIGTSQISPGEVAYFVGRELDMPLVTRPFLVRGLARTESIQTIRIIGNALWVSSKEAPGDQSSLRRQPLVLIMQEVPELVYVTTEK
ncbi:MAG: hypothetical protein ACI915_000220 [Gammaproteobacteria bacterium]|jgi:hypothetical protein